MTNQATLKQYQEMGEDYTNNQRTFFADKEDWTRTAFRSELQKVRSGLVLDIGCGAGDDVKWCEENGIKAFGIDPVDKMCQLAKETINQPENIKLGSYEDIPFANQYFDLVMGRFSLHYLKDFRAAYREIARVLKTGGQLLLTVSHPTFDAFRISRTKEKLVSVKLYNGKVSVKFPAHHLKDYFSTTFFGLFDLQDIKESASIDADNPDKIPETLFYTAKKR